MQQRPVVQVLRHALETSLVLRRLWTQKVAALFLVSLVAKGAKAQMWRKAGAQAQERKQPLRAVQLLWVVPWALLLLLLLPLPVLARYALPASAVASVSSRSSLLPVEFSSRSHEVLRAY